jgi:hypothetical protein
MERYCRVKEDDRRYAAIFAIAEVLCSNTMEFYTSIVKQYELRKNEVIGVH